MKILALVTLMFLGGVNVAAPVSATEAAAATSVSVADATGDVKNLNSDVKPSKAVRQDADIRSVDYSVTDTNFVTVLKATNLADTKDANSVLAMMIMRYDEYGDSYHLPVAFEIGGSTPGLDQYTSDMCPEATGKASKKTDTIKIVLPLSCLEYTESITVDIQRLTWDTAGKGSLVRDKSSLKDKLPLS